MSTSSSQPAVPERNSLVVVIVLTLVTLGFYVPIWFLRRRRSLNRLNSPIKIGVAPPLLMLGLQVASLVVGLLTESFREDGLSVPAAFVLWRYLISIGFLILLFKLAFTVREILSDHLKDVLSALSDRPVQYLIELSTILTLVFSVWYLQYKINECADLSRQWTALDEGSPTA